MARSSSFLRPAEAFLFSVVIGPFSAMATLRDLLAIPLSELHFDPVPLQSSWFWSGYATRQSYAQ
ncbi:hypothetical protein ASPTUDRAFT_63601 [Aspergillus tubingensis CBS 134.48]|uniref:Uncharacterized protein n=1 Tax=Aspergillus tubingensis (strain CBS 134.48) TaxID=767770 RepID=A0A1L9NAC0_ASPTC|nr:hypothetical protein ASPTUDRAFT_63601 [Aspergillus tubingensis CBS 134.48]